MNKKYSFLIFILVTSIPAIIINFHVFLKGNQPELSNAFVSILFLLFWLSYGTFMGYKNNEYFLKLSTLYWVIGCLIYVLAYNFHLLVFAPVVILVFGPLYGLRYFIEIPADVILATISVFLVLSLAWIGYYLGKRIVTR